MLTSIYQPKGYKEVDGVACSVQLLIPIAGHGLAAQEEREPCAKGIK
jgi:hypothetical protein